MITANRKHRMELTKATIKSLFPLVRFYLLRVIHPSCAPLLPDNPNCSSFPIPVVQNKKKKKKKRTNHKLFQSNRFVIIIIFHKLNRSPVSSKNTTCNALHRAYSVYKGNGSRRVKPIVVNKSCTTQGQQLRDTRASASNVPENQCAG